MHHEQVGSCCQGTYVPDTAKFVFNAKFKLIVYEPSVENEGGFDFG